VMEVEVTLEE